MGEKLRVGGTCKLKKWNGPRRHESVLKSDERVCEMAWNRVDLPEKRWELHLEVVVPEGVCGEWQRYRQGLQAIERPVK
jgi:hypothetical protein